MPESATVLVEKYEQIKGLPSGVGVTKRNFGM